MIGKSLLSPLKSNPFRALWVGQTFSRLGDCIMTVLLPMTVYSMSKSAMAMSLVMALMFLPKIILLPFTGVLVDRLSRVMLMIISDLCRFVILLILAYLYYINSLSITTIYLYAVLSGIMGSLFQPAYSAVRAQVFTEDIRISANSLTQISEQFALLVGPLLGGLIITFSSPATGFALDGLTFFISIISLLFINIKTTVSNIEGKPIAKFYQDFLGGLQVVSKNPWLWITIIASAFLNVILLSFSSVLIPWLIKVDLFSKTGSSYYGILMSASGAGALFMALLYSSKTRWTHRGILAYFSIFVAGISLGCLGLISFFPILIVLLVVVGMSIMFFNLTWEISLQEFVPKDVFGRVASLDLMGSYILLPIGYILTGWLWTSIGGIYTIFLEGFSLIIISILPVFISSLRKYN
ncbi:MAG TPA: MFS transporter [Clostridiaceae bacterium]